MMNSILSALGIPCQVIQTSCRKKVVAEVCLQEDPKVVTCTETGKGMEISWGLCELLFNGDSFNFVLMR